MTTSTLIYSLGDLINYLLTYLFTYLLDISKGMRAVELCTNKILQFLTAMDVSANAG